MISGDSKPCPKGLGSYRFKVSKEAVRLFGATLPEAEGHKKPIKRKELTQTSKMVLPSVSPTGYQEVRHSLAETEFHQGYLKHTHT